MASITDIRMCNHEAEKKLLGSLIQFARKNERYFSQLTARDFDKAYHVKVFKAMEEMRTRKQPIDLITLDAAHPELGFLELTDIAQTGTDLTAYVDEYLSVVKQASARRAFYRMGEGISKESQSDDFDAGKLTEKIRLHLKGYIQADGEETGIQDDLMQMYDAIFDPKNGAAGIMVNIPGLDALTGGLKPGRLYVIGARPSVGKTVFGLNAALRAALAGKSVLYINREMEKVDMLKRMTANLSGINMNAMEGSCVPEDQQEKLVDTVALMNTLPIHISNKARTPAQIRAKAVEIQEKEGLGLVVVDYLQRMSAGVKCNSRDEEVGSISMAIKDLAMDLRIPVILLSQLNRSASNVRPNMAMLRESGNIEQDADVIVLLHAPDASDVPANRQIQYRTVINDNGRYLEMIVDKNRHGGNGIVPVAFYGDKMRYVPLKG